MTTGMPAQSTADGQGRDGGPITHGYRAVWRWHFLAALWTAPVLIILALTGAIYLFDREFEGWWNRDVLSLAVPAGRSGAESLPLVQQETIIAAHYPGSSIRRVVLPRTADEATVWAISDKGAAINVYIDPYRGTVTGTTDPASQPMSIVRDIHGTLFAGEIGSHVVELIACWALVLMATGIWLWWPRKWRLRGVIVPRLGASGRRYWRDLHAIPSIINALFVILLVLTGLPWSAFWGPQFAKLGEVVPFVAASPNFKAPPTVDGTTGGDPHAIHNSQMDDPKLPWTIKHSKAPGGHAGHSGHADHSGHSGHRSSSGGIAAAERLLPALAMHQWGGGARIIYPRAPGDVFMISYVPDKAEGQRTLYINPGTGAVIGNIGWAEYSPVAKAVEWGVMLHMGRQYGLANQIANLLVCLTLIGATIAGLTLWWKRRPAGSLGAPTLARGDRLPGTVRAMLVALAILFPLVGVTMVIALALGYIKRRVATQT